jgi:hypothetical protein
VSSKLEAHSCNVRRCHEDTILAAGRTTAGTRPAGDGAPVAHALDHGETIPGFPASSAVKVVETETLCCGCGDSENIGTRGSAMP